MPIKRKTALVIIFLFTLILFFFLTGINTCTVIYHNFDGTGEIYTKTYFIPFYRHEISLDTPMEPDSFLFSGWHTDQRGLYLLCELVETGINRVDIEIPFDTEDIDINFFLELGGELNGFPLSPVEGADTNWGDYFSCEIIYPVNNVITRHQEEYIYAYMQLVNEAILTRNWESIIDLVNIRSFADWYLVNEIVLNAHIGWSMFAYKLQVDKLYLGPLWDFDQTCGVSISCGPDYETWYPASKTQNTWFNTLLEMDEFKALLASRWKECLPEIQHFLAEEQQKSILYQKDIAANFERWPALGTTVWRMRKEIGDFDTYEENTAYLFDWLENRIEWLSSELGSY